MITAPSIKSQSQRARDRDKNQLILRIIEKHQPISHRAAIDKIELGYREDYLSETTSSGSDMIRMRICIRIDDLVRDGRILAGPRPKRVLSLP